MSCPYLEKGRIAYCHAFGEKGIEVEKSDIEGVCFSGEFGECSFLFPQSLANTGKAEGRKILSSGLSRTFFRETRLPESGVSTEDEL